MYVRTVYGYNIQQQIRIYTDVDIFAIWLYYTTTCYNMLSTENIKSYFAKIKHLQTLPTFQNFVNFIKYIWIDITVSTQNDYTLSEKLFITSRQNFNSGALILYGDAAL